MTDTLEPLVLDVVEWVAQQPRRYSEFIEVWRTSCPRLTVWEDALDRGYLRRKTVEGRGTMVVATAQGQKFLRDNGRLSN